MLLLTPFNIGHILMDKGYIDAKSLVEGQFSVRNSSSRNKNYIINKEKEAPLFVKQPKILKGEQANSVFIEASCYWLANNEKAYENLKDFLPKYHTYDYLNHILILECIKDSSNLYEYYSKEKQFPLSIPKQLASLLGSYHQKILTEIKGDRSEKLFPKNIPFIFRLGDENRHNWWPGRNEAEKQMLQLIDNDGNFRDLIKKAKETWTIDSLTHGDIKSTNILINNLDDGFKIRLIDWELADLGDSALDIAAIFHMYIILWIYSQEMSKDGNKFAIAYHNFTLAQIQPSMITFWENYAKTLNIDINDQQTKLTKIAKFCGLRLVQSCFEMTTESTALTPHAAQTLQLSVNILRDPQKAISDIFGINLKNQAHHG